MKKKLDTRVQELTRDIVVQDTSDLSPIKINILKERKKKKKN